MARRLLLAFEILSFTALILAFGLSVLPILQSWDTRLWPNEAVLAHQVERRREAQELRSLGLTLRSSQVHPFLARWTLSPSIAYWSRQPGVAGNSHEALPGTADTARFYLETEFPSAREILRNRQIDWVLSDDPEADREFRDPLKHLRTRSTSWS